MMSLNITPKAAFLGTVLSVTLLVGVAAQSSTPTEPEVQLGRYQLAAGSGNQAFVLDTATGEVWANYDPMFKQAKLKAARKP